MFRFLLLLSKIKTEVKGLFICLFSDAECKPHSVICRMFYLSTGALFSRGSMSLDCSIPFILKETFSLY